MARTFLLGSVLGVLPMAASGQTPAAIAALDPATSDTSVGENIVVTARRREERSQDVPIAITAIGGAQLQSRGIRDVEQLRFAVPALQVSPSPFGAAVPGYTIRSQRQLESLITQDPSVGIYVADVVQQRPHGSNQALYDLESVQVLKGPQGTLFGRNTTGGAILITPARPSFDLGGSIGVQLGDYGRQSVTGVLNVPLSDQLALRVAGRLTRRDGYVHNVANGQRTDSERTENARVSLLWRPSESFSSYFIGTYFHEDDAGFGLRLFAVRSGSAAAGTPGILTELTRAQGSDFHTVSNSRQPVTRIKTYTASNITTLDLGGVTLKNIIGYRHVDSFGSFDYDGTSTILFESQNRLKSRQWSDELQLLGKAFENKLSYILGGYYFNERGRDTQNSVLFGTRTNDGEGENSSYSLFAQGDYKLAPTLTATVGARYTWDARKLSTFNRLNGTCRLVATNVPLGAPGAQPLDPCVRATSVKFSAPTWLATLSWKAAPSTLLYATYSRGYRSGGLPLRANLPAETTPFKPEIVDNFEAGLKTDALGGKVRLNLAAYYQRYKNIQRTLSFGSPLTTVVLNAANATIKGGEAELTVRPARWIEFGGTLAYSDARYGSFTGPGLGDLSANRFALAPKTVYTGSIRLIPPLPASAGDMSFRLGYYHQSNIFVADINDIPLPAYGIVDLSADWRNLGGTDFDLSLFVKNLTKKKYATGGVSVYPSTGTLAVTLGAPRHFGAELIYRFGAKR